MLSNFDRKSLFKFFGQTAAVFGLAGIFMYFLANLPALRLKIRYDLGLQPPLAERALADIKAKAQKPEQGNFLVIPKINVKAPLEEPASLVPSALYEALGKGVLHYPGTAWPGEGSNVFLVGHSSAPGNVNPAAAHVFALLDKLKKGDEIIIFYRQKEYRYQVYERVKVKPQETAVWEATRAERLSLMTCWPVGTNFRRLIVRARPL